MRSAFNPLPPSGARHQHENASIRPCAAGAIAIPSALLGAGSSTRFVTRFARDKFCQDDRFMCWRFTRQWTRLWALPLTGTCA